MNNQQSKQPNNPLHGLTLENILLFLVESYGWKKLGKYIDIKCFNSEPSIKSSLKFLRKSPWARTKVESLYIVTRNNEEKKRHPQKSKAR
jgi:uncharacterized protein (DUF2132 family)